MSWSYRPETIRQWDVISEQRSPGRLLQLMENAGAAVAREALQWLPDIKTFLILAGKGNNGGDAIVAARHLAAAGRVVRLFLTNRVEELSPASRTMYEQLPETVAVGENLEPADFYPSQIIIDGILGTGISGPVRNTAGHWIDWINKSSCPVLAIDLPSGLNGESGESEKAVIADLTVALAGFKTGYFRKKGPELCGRLHLAEIGIDPEIINASEGVDMLFAESDVRLLLKREAFDTFKNRRGAVAVLGGSVEYCGAPFLSGIAALRSGSGYVSVLVPPSCRVPGNVPLSLIVRQETYLQLPKADALVLGPGWGSHPENMTILDQALNSTMPLVLDADGLNLLTQKENFRKIPRRNQVILTPHPGEMVRLLQFYGLQSTQNRALDAVMLAEKSNFVVVLKGCRTVVAAPDGRCSINLSGCAALATAGSGDVLAGVCGAFMAQKYDAFSAAKLAVYCHGLAGELLRPCGSRGILADDLPEAIARAMQKIVPVC